jgi:hypothetical protein
MQALGVEERADRPRAHLTFDARLLEGLAGRRLVIGDTGLGPALRNAPAAGAASGD